MSDGLAVVYVRLTREEHAAIKRAALRAGKSVNEWAVGLMLAELQRLRDAGISLQFADEAEAAREVA